MKSKGGLILSLLFALLVVGYMVYQRSDETRDQKDRIQVEDGKPVYQTDDSKLDMDSTQPLVKCYPVSSPSEFDINQRMDFETRSTKGWVGAPDEAGDNEFCIEETQAAVDKRLAD